MEILKMTALELSKAIKSKEITVRQATQAVLDAIADYDGTYNCYTCVCEKEALERADEVQKLIDEGKLDASPLAGVPIAVKDNICTKGITTTCSSKILSNFKPTYNATVVERLNEAGMVIVGKLNMDEFAMGSTTETSYFGATKNPWNIECVPGGSSGGAAASVAADEAIIALGSDTGGSIRQPCSFCGVTGLKPTYGSVSRYGLVAYASSLDQIGPIGKDVADCAAMYSIISGRDEKDGTSMDFEKFDYTEVLKGEVKGKKIGIPSDYFGEGIAKDVKKKVLAAAEKLKEMGAEIEEFDMPIVKYAIPAYYIIASAEACSNLSRYDGIKYGYKSESARNLRETYIKSRSEGFGMEVKRRIMLGNFVLSSGYYDAYYKKALQAKKLIQQSFFDAFEKYDMLLGPVAPTTALKLGESLSDPLKMYLGDIYTVMINIAGLPAVSVPCGFDSNNMPVGLQLIGKPFDEKTIMQVAYQYEKATDFSDKKPNLIKA
ncbi:MAG: Asp-tRNA(Asn)/Glu-tRNA(Gln) amidotransferase subunit GatA [Clostridiales bacterium]|nr:Asp-tRNA(Asn)/Glu-tRNA(Gln) amidotransferase subunit GatA [Clostridiales bacterium]